MSSETPETGIAAPRVASPLTLAACALFAFIILGQGVSAPFQKDAEPQSAEWVVSIVRDGHWLVPLDYYGFPDRKPPLFYWLSALVADGSGGVVDETRARVVSVIAGVALTTTVLVWTTANIGAIEGLLAFLLLLGTYGFASRATEALTDMLMSALLFAAYAALHPLLSAPPDSVGSKRGSLAVGVLLGLAVLAKGPVAIVLLALAALIFLGFERRNPLQVLRQPWPWQIAGLAIFIAALWYAPALLLGGRKIPRIIFFENFGHFMPTKFGGTGESSRPFYFIVARMAGGALPMTLLILPAALAFYTGEIAPAKRRAVLYQLSLSLAVLIFFSVASVKRDDYILPALPGIAILCASIFVPSMRGTASKLRDAIVVVFAAVSILIFVSMLVFAHVAPPIKLRSSDQAYFAIFQSMHGALLVFLLASLAVAAFTLLELKRSNSALVGLAFGCLGLLSTLVWTTRLRPNLASQRSIKSFIPAIVAQVKGDQLCIVSGLNFELSYYYGAGVFDLAHPECQSSPAGKPIYLFATPRDLDATTPDYRARLKLVASSNLIGGGGPPSLYEVSNKAAK